MLEDKIPPTEGNTKWFVHDRFGMFIHWGLYAMPARHEWVKSYEKIPEEHYEKYFRYFDPDLFDPKEWAESAYNAGMRYFVITTKHHEGFCLWDSNLTDYKATNTAAGRDLLKETIAAFRDIGMKIGLYHSLLDWHHPQYTPDICHPYHEDPAFLTQAEERDIQKYVDYLHAQTKELLTNYGKIDILWYDFSIEATGGFPAKGKDVWRSEELIRTIRKLQPEIMINNRLDVPADVETPEQCQPREWVMVDGKPRIWEACQTFSGSWGYHRDEESWKSVEMLVKMLIDSVSKGGNLLLNVGPNARGQFDDRARKSLDGMGKWMYLHNRSIYGCTQAPEEYCCPQDCRLTWHPEKKRLYIHIFSWPFKQLHFDNAAGKIQYAQLLNDGSEIQMEEKDGTIMFLLPVKKPDAAVPVIEVMLE